MQYLSVYSIATASVSCTSVTCENNENWEILRERSTETRHPRTKFENWMKSRNIFFRKKNSNSLVQYTQFYVCSRKKNKQKQREGGKATTKRIIMENNKAQREESERAPDIYTFFFFKRVTLKPARESCATKRSNIYPKYPRESDSQLHRATIKLFD